MSPNSSSSSTRPTGAAGPNRARTAQAKIAAQRAAQRRRRRLTLAGSSIAVVVALFAALLIAKAAGAGDKSADAAVGPSPSSSLTTQTVAAATHVPASALNAVGAGSVSNPPTRINGAALTADGKPQVVYLGYEWCPYCAAQRWPLVVALSRFGTFTGLGLTQSASDDVYPSTNTFTFAKATYTSKYLAFSGVEMQDGNRNPLQTPTAAEQQLLSVYDAPPYVSASAAGGIPFLDLGGEYVISGASYNPQTLAGQNWSGIASSLAQPSSASAQGIEGSANAMTAALCDLTGQQPAAVCTSSGVVAAKAVLK